VKSQEVTHAKNHTMAQREHHSKCLDQPLFFHATISCPKCSREGIIRSRAVQPEKVCASHTTSCSSTRLQWFQRCPHPHISRLFVSLVLFEKKLFPIFRLIKLQSYPSILPRFPRFLLTSFYCIRQASERVRIRISCANVLHLIVFLPKCLLVTPLRPRT
jgi:hypothetical protein